MIDWLGVGHLFELSAAEAIAGFFTPLAIFLLFFLAQLILPARRVTGYVINPETGQPRNYRLNGLIVYVLALAVWAFALEPLGVSRDWFYRSTIYAIAGGTVFCFAIFPLGLLQPAARRNKEPLRRLLGRPLPGVLLFQGALRLQDVPVRRGRDDAGAQRPVRGGLAL